MSPTATVTSSKMPVLKSIETGDKPSAADKERLARMFVAHHTTVWRSLRRRGLTADAAADATQETFLVAAARLNDISPDSERAFLISTARRMAHTLRRKTMRWVLDEKMDSRSERAKDRVEALGDVQLCDLALSTVPEDQAEVFVLYELEGLTSPEIAAVLGIPIGSVASRLRRGRQQFRSALARLQARVDREERA